MAAITIAKATSLDKLVEVDSLPGLTFMGENSAHQFVITCTKGKVEQALSGSVSARFMRADGTTILLAGDYAVIEDGKAVVTLHQDCYNVPGRFKFAVMNTDSGATACIYACVGTVLRTQTENIIDSGDVIPDLSELLAQIEACEDATADARAVVSGAVRYDISQSLTAAQKAQAQANIGATPDTTLSVVGSPADAAAVGDLKSAFDDVVNDTMEVSLGTNICPPNLTDGYISADGSIVVYSDWGTTDYIDVRGLTAVVFSATGRETGLRRTVSMFYLTTYDANKNRIAQVANPSSTYTIDNGVAYIRFSVHRDIWTDLMLQSGTTAGSYTPYNITYKAVNDEYALKTDVNVITAKVSELDSAFTDIAQKDYKLYSPTFSLSPSAIWDNGALINTITGVKTTDYIDCSEWKGIRYTGANWLGARALAFYDENHAWISSLPEVGNTTYFTNEIVSIPQNAKYVVFADLTSKVAQTLKIEVATDYKIVGKWVGKKWACVGDSLTESNLRTTMNYHDYVAQKTGITVINMGRSGTGYKRTYDEGYAFYQRIANVPLDSDVVTIFGSGNDLLYIDDLGTPTDSGADENPATICGCINKTIDSLIALIPTVQLGIVAPTPWIGNQPTLGNTNSMGRYVEALRQICYIRSIPFLDLYHSSNLRPWTAEGRAACYSKDNGGGVHPDEAGHKIISSRFEGFLDSLLLAN